MESSDGAKRPQPPCHRCGCWVPERERSIDEYRNGNRFILCNRCTAMPPDQDPGPYPMNVFH